MHRTQKLAPLVAALVLQAAAPAVADGWRWTVTPYAWATNVGIDVEVADRELVDETIPVEDLLEDLDTIAQVRVEAQKGAHGLFLDLFDVNLSDDATTRALPSGRGEATFTPEMGMTILDLGGIYDPRGDGAGFQLLYGARILNQRATIDAEVAFADGSTSARELEIDDTLVDALVGFRYLRPIGERFTFQAQADLSAGGTELTWSAGPTLGYRFGRSGRYTALAGYRHMVVEFDTPATVDATMTLSGFLAGLRISL